MGEFWGTMFADGSPIIRRRRGTACDRFNTQKNDAKRRGIVWELTFEQWCAIWLSSGHWHERGRGKGKYVMARHGDTGPYAVGNVRIASWEENRREQIIAHSPETRAKQSAASLNPRAEVRARMRAAALAKKHTKKTREKLRAIANKQWSCPENRARLSEAMKAWHASRRSVAPPLVETEVTDTDARAPAITRGPLSHAFTNP